jgi:hypothetical protein
MFLPEVAAPVVGLLALALLSAAAWPPGLSAQQNPPAGSSERVLFDAANRERAAKGLLPLRWDESLATAARQHAEQMAQRNLMSHQLPGEPSVEERATRAGARYSVIAENVAEGGTPEAIHSGWMHSAPHRANLLAPEVDSVGIAVAEKKIGGRLLFAVEDFSRVVANLSLQDQEKQVAALLGKRGLQPSEARDEARKTCEMDHGVPGSSAALVVRYEAADLSRLPENLEKQIQSGSYHTAAVGACEPAGGTGSMRFRVAVLLF